MRYLNRQDDDAWERMLQEGAFPFWKDIVDEQPLLPKKNLAIKQRTRGGLLAALEAFFIPVSTGITISKKEILGKQQKAKKLLTVLAQQQAAITEQRLKTYFGRLELWLGIACGVATRISSRLAITWSFAPESKAAAIAVEFIACAAAGLLAGLVAHLVCALYRNSKIPYAQKKEKYISRHLLQGAAMGLVGGIIGGCCINAHAILKNASSTAIGAFLGIAAGILYAAIKEYQASRKRKKNLSWKKLATHGAVYGALGSVMGIVGANLFNTQATAAVVPVGSTGTALTISPPPDTLISPSVLLQHNTTKTLGMCPVTTPHASTPAPDYYLRHVNPCEVEAKPKHVKHIKHVKHVKHIAPKPLPPLPEKIIAELPPPRPLPPAPPPDPCGTGLCDTLCDTPKQLDLKGPCADPMTPCVQRVSFNEDGIATKAVLEPQRINHRGAYFEIDHQPQTGTAGWKQAAKYSTVAPDKTKTQISLVIPFNKTAFSA